MRLFLVALAFISFSTSAQVIDELRLVYDQKAIVAKQIGISASHDGNFIAIAYNNQTVKIFDVRGGRLSKTINNPFKDVFDVRLNADGSKLVLVEGKEVRIVDLLTEKEIKQWRLKDDATRTSYEPTNNLFAVGQLGGWVSIFDLKNLSEVKELRYEKHHVSALDIHPDGKKIAVGVMSALRNANSLKIFEMATGNVLAESEESFYTIFNFNEKGTESAGGGLKGIVAKATLDILDASTLKPKKELLNKVQWVSLDIYHSAYFYGKYLMATTISKSFDVVNTETGEVIFTTKRDKVKMIATFAKFGVDVDRIFPLGNTGKFLVNYSGNNISQIYDVNSNSIIGYFFTNGADGYAVVGKDGRLEGSPEALASVYWSSRKSVKKTSLESLFEKGFTPKLFGDLISGSSDNAVAFEVDDVINKVPSLTVKSVNGIAFTDRVQMSQKNISIEGSVIENLSEASEIRLYQNAKLVKSIMSPSSTTFKFDAVLNSSFGEENFFYIVASSKSGVESEKIKFVIDYKGATDQPARFFLITVGINQYKNPKYNLNYALADADGFDKSLKQSASSLFGEVLTYSIRNDKALKENIYKAFDDIKNKAREQDVVMVYYAGHGVMSSPSPNEKEEFYLVTHDVTQLYGKDELLKDRAISATELRSIASKINAQKQVFILDACQSAGALEAMSNRGAAEEKAIAQLARSTGTFWITATGSDQFATEFEKLGHGIFTYSLLEGISGDADTNKDLKLTIRELSTYIENKVPELSEQLKGSPQFPSAYSFGNDFPILVLKR